MDWYSRKINEMYGLDEPEWQSFFTSTDDQVLMQFCYYSETRYGHMTEHEQEKRLFALWHEIEKRSLYSTTEPEQGTFEYPWEGLAPMPVFKNERERFDWEMDQIVGGSATYHNLQAPPGRRRKVGFNNTPDEENLGLYRRERKD